MHELKIHAFAALCSVMRLRLDYLMLAICCISCVQHVQGGRMQRGILGKRNVSTLSENVCFLFSLLER